MREYTKVTTSFFYSPTASSPKLFFLGEVTWTSAFSDVNIHLLVGCHSYGRGKIKIMTFPRKYTHFLDMLFTIFTFFSCYEVQVKQTGYRYGFWSIYNYFFFIFFFLSLCNIQYIFLSFIFQAL